MHDPQPLVLSGDLSLETTKRILAPLEPIWRERRPFLSLDVDLSNLGFIYPSALALLTTAILQLSLDGVSVDVRRPTNEDVDDYLNRMDFYQLVGVRTRYPHQRRDPTGRFIELRKVESEEEGDAVVREIMHILQQRMPGMEGVWSAVQYAFYELVNNVFHHAQSPTGAIICAQAYDQKQEIELGVVDSGRGIPSSLGENTDLRNQFVTASEAIELAVKPRVTGRPDENTGEGLFLTLELVKANRGFACLHSEDGMLRVGYRGKPAKPAALWPGTWVGLRFRTDHPVNTCRVFDQYAPPENDYEWLFDD